MIFQSKHCLLSDIYLAKFGVAFWNILEAKHVYPSGYRDRRIRIPGLKLDINTRKSNKYEINLLNLIDQSIVFKLIPNLWNSVQ